MKGRADEGWARFDDGQVGVDAAAQGVISAQWHFADACAPLEARDLLRHRLGAVPQRWVDWAAHFWPS